ncbi:hypothetical protein AB0Q95_06455 [Streptomyces sp. NPDC059900]
MTTLRQKPLQLFDQLTHIFGTVDYNLSAAVTDCDSRRRAEHPL